MMASIQVGFETKAQTFDAYAFSIYFFVVVVVANFVMVVMTAANMC